MSFATAIYAEMCSMFDERVNSHEATVNLDVAISALEDTRKKLSLKYHPDKSAEEHAEEKFKCIAPAKKQLEKTVKREYSEEKLQIKREKEEAKRRQNETQARRRNLAMQTANGLRFHAQQLPPTSFETVTEPCPPATEKEVSAPATGAAEQEDVKTIPDTSLPPNTAALDIFNGIVDAIKNKTLKVPMNGYKEYSPETLKRNVAPIRSLLENKFHDVPVSSNETDLVRILDTVATRTDVPKTDAQLKKLPTSAKWFLKVLRSNVGDDFAVAPCDVTPVEETMEPDATPVSFRQEDAPHAPQQSVLVTETTRSPSCKKREANTSRTMEEDVESTTEAVTHPVKMQKKSNNLMALTDFVLDHVKGGKITVPNTSKGTPYASGSVKGYCGQVRKLLKGDVNGITIDVNETNPFRVLHNVLKTQRDVIGKHDAGCNNQLSCGIEFILKLHKQFPQFEF